MLSELTAGLRFLADGAVASLRGDRSGALVVAHGHARYHEINRLARVFTGGNQAAATFGAGLSATNAVIGLYNPLDSGRLLSLLSCHFAFSAAPAAAAVIGYAVSTQKQAAPPTTITTLTVRCAQIGNTSQPVGILFSVGTLVAAPAFIRPLVSIVAASSITPPVVNDEVAGQIQLLPGYAVVLQATAAAVGLAGFTWEESDL